MFTFSSVHHRTHIRDAGQSNLVARSILELAWCNPPKRVLFSGSEHAARGDIRESDIAGFQYDLNRVVLCL